MAKISIPQSKLTELPEYQLYTKDHQAFNGQRPTPLANEHNEELATFDTSAANIEKAIARQIDYIQQICRIKFEQTVGNTVWHSKKPATEMEWRAAPRTIVKTTSDILSNPVDRVTFGREELQNLAEIKKALDSIIIDPRRINDTLLSNLGLEKYIPAKKTKRVPGLIQRAEAIPEIRGMIVNLRPFIHAHEFEESKQKYFRLMRISNGKNDGYILGTQHANNGQKVLFKTDIYGAERRLAHIQQRCGEEIHILKTIQDTLKKIHTSLMKWHEIKDTDAIKTLMEALTSCVDKLEFVEKPEKIKMREQIKKALTVRYKSGKQNPGAMLACLITAIDSLGRRTEEIEHINEYLGGDRIRLQGKIEDEQIPTQNFLSQVEKHHHELRILRPSQVPLTLPERQKIMHNLQNLLQDVENMQSQPNLMFGKKYKNIITELLQKLESYDEKDISGHESMRKLFVTLYALGKMHRTMLDLKKVHYTVSLNEKTYDPKDLVAELEKIYAQIKQTRIAQDVVAPQEMKNAYISIYEHLRNLTEEAKKSLEGRDDTSAQKAKMEPTLTEVLIGKIQHIPMLRRMLEALKGQRDKPIQQPLPFTVDKQKTAKTIKGKLKEFKWEDALASL